MKKYIKIIFGLTLLVSLTLTSCKEQIVESPITPGGYGYSLATFTTDFAGSTITEGETMTYKIKLDKALDRSVTFSLNILDGTCDDHDLIWDPVVISPYQDSAVFTVTFVAEDIPEVQETIKFEIGAFGLAERHLLDPATSNPIVDLTVENLNKNGLTVAIAWPDDHDDWDAYLIDEAGAGIDYGTTNYDWAGFGGETGADPEILLFDVVDWYPWVTPDGIYFADASPWDVSSDPTDFTISVGHPDGTVEIFNLTFEMAKADAGDYPVTWGYSMLKIVKTGASYDVSILPEWTGTKSVNGLLEQRGNFSSMRTSGKL